MKNDHNTNLEELKKMILEFCEERDWGQFHTAKDLAIGAVTEASELLEHFRFLNEDQCLGLFEDSIKRQAIADELADVLFFLLRFSEKYQIDLTGSFVEKMKKNSLKYPVEGFKGKNHKSDISLTELNLMDQSKSNL